MNSPEFLDKPSTRPFQGEPNARQLRDAQKSIEKAEIELKLRAQKAEISTENIEKKEKEEKGWSSGMGVNPNEDTEKNDLFKKKFGDFVKDRNEAIADGTLKVGEVLSLDVPIFDNTNRGFSSELVSFYILKAIDQWHEKWSRKFTEAEFEGLKDVLQVDISPMQKRGGNWARFTLEIQLKPDWVDHLINRFFKNISPRSSTAQFVFYLTDKEEIKISF